jgi:hypothetical protein
LENVVSPSPNGANRAVPVVSSVPADPATASAWARRAAVAALQVPAEGVEAEAWAVRGLAEVALGCALLGSPAAYAELDDVVRSVGIRAGGLAAARLRRLRALAGPVPAGYPEAVPLPRARAVPRQARLAAGSLSRFCSAIAAAAHKTRRVSTRTPWPDVSDAQLRWAEKYRCSPVGADVVTVRPSLPEGLVWRSWFRLPWAGRTATVVVERPAHVPRAQRLIWRGVHDGAHLDHIDAVARLTGAAPSPLEFGHGLAVAEAYAMAVEITATVSCLLDGEIAAARQLRAGLVERIERLAVPMVPVVPAAEFGPLVTLAEAYVAKPLLLLAGASPGPLLPAGLRRALVGRWTELCAVFPAASRLNEEAQALSRGR